MIHGGPGAPGSMAAVARELSRYFGVLEPLQTAASIEGQLEELKNVLECHGRLPVTLIGHSWGAWLSLIFAARYPSHVKKLILIGSGPFEEPYSRNIMETRLERLSEKDRRRVLELARALDTQDSGDREAIFKEFGKLMSAADSYDPIHHSDDNVEFREDIYRSVWKEADELRRSGELLRIAEQVQCPVIAIHGDYDPHPAEGVEKPLSKVVKDFRFMLLNNCGHEPWMEKEAKEKFFQILKEVC